MLDLTVNPGDKSVNCQARYLVTEIMYLFKMQAHFILMFSPLTTTLAVNYMDRYIENNLSVVSFFFELSPYQPVARSSLLTLAHN
jgi:hypothetical protein